MLRYVSGAGAAVPMCRQVAAGVPAVPAPAGDHGGRQQAALQQPAGHPHAHGAQLPIREGMQRDPRVGHEPRDSVMAVPLFPFKMPACFPPHTFLVAFVAHSACHMVSLQHSQVLSNTRGGKHRWPSL